MQLEGIYLLGQHDPQGLAEFGIPWLECPRCSHSPEGSNRCIFIGKSVAYSSL